MSGSFRVRHKAKKKKAKPNDIPGAPGSLPGNGFLCALKKYFNGIRLIAFAIKWFRNQKQKKREEKENRVFEGRITASGELPAPEKEARLLIALSKVGLITHLTAETGAGRMQRGQGYGKDLLSLERPRFGS